MHIESVSGTLPRSVYTAAQVRELDRLAIEQTDGGGYTLMRHAGKAIFRQIMKTYPALEQLEVWCGGGNNGGDGYVVAELALQAGLEITVYALSDPASLKGEAATAYQHARDAGVSVQSARDLLTNPNASGEGSHKYEGPRGQAGASAPHSPQSRVVVDAMLGTGLEGDVRGDYAEAIRRINDYGVPVVAADIPSGLHADSGRVLGLAIEADFTVTFIGIKQGLLTGQAPDYVGDLYFDDLGVASEIFTGFAQESETSLVAWEAARCALPKRKPADHKGKWGRVLVIGGDIGFGGAPIMAAEGAARAGAGLVTCITQLQHHVAGLARCPEVMYGWAKNPAQLKPYLEHADIVAIGPGLGRGAWGRMCLATVLDYSTRSQIGLVLDADALNLVAEAAISLPSRSVLTPHPGEAARLLQCSIDAIEADRFASARALAKKFGCTTVLKGAGTLIADSDEAVAVSCYGNPGMACGGMGDVLTGITAAVGAVVSDTFLAAQVAVAWHGRAGDAASEKMGPQTMLATDLAANLGNAFFSTEESRSLEAECV